MLWAEDGQRSDLVVRGARVLDPMEGLDAACDVRVDGGTIAELGTSLDANGHRVVDGAALAELAAEQASAPEPGAIVGQSARNRFTGIVTRVIKDKVAAQVEIQAGPHRVVSLMTSEAAEELGLAPGDLAVAAVKATNVVIEVPRG